MNPSDLTVDEVQSELRVLIDKYPERTGRVYTGCPGEFICVYYTNENGKPITVAENFEDEEPNLVTPVCIIGQWIESFHQEFKSNPMIWTILQANDTLSACRSDRIPFNREVLEVLCLAQDSQDGFGMSWKDIKLD